MKVSKSIAEFSNLIEQMKTKRRLKAALRRKQRPAKVVMTDDGTAGEVEAAKRMALERKKDWGIK